MGKRTPVSSLARVRRSFAGCSTFGAQPISEAAEAMNLKPAAVKALVESGQLVAIRVRGEVMIPNSEIEQWATRQG